MEIEKEKLIEVCFKRIEREYNKLLIESRPMPLLYLEGYRTAILDILWDYDKEIWKEFVKRFGKLIRELEAKSWKTLNKGE
jgi:broad specificity phosphatase PhoE